MNETVEKVFEYIDVIAAKLGVASEHVYGALIQKSFTTGIVQVGVAFILIGVYIFMWKYLSKRLDRNNKDLIVSSLALGGIVIFIITMINLYIGTLKIINPEYYAMKEIMTLIKGE